MGLIYFNDMKHYLIPGFAATIIYLIINEVIIRKKGYKMTWLYVASMMLFGVYLTCVFSVTVSPVYGFLRAPFGRNINLVPFAVIKTILSDPLNFFGNIVIFIPIGFMLVLLYERCKKIYNTILIGAALSTIIEILQLFGSRGTDIDDVILNTIGTIIGYIIVRIVISFCPKLNKSIGFKENGKKTKRIIKGSVGQLPILLVVVLISVFAAGYVQLYKMSYVSNSMKASTIKVKRQTKPVYKVKIEAVSAFLWNTSSNEVLYKKNENKKVSPASTTKLLTALTALEFCNLDEKVVVGDEVKLIAKDASRAGLHSGDVLNVKQLMDALLLPSGNDAAYVLAAFTGRKIAKENVSTYEAVKIFVSAMNDEAIKLGATDSNFVSPDGYDADGQYTTAYDLAHIADKFLQNKELSEIVGSDSIRDVWLDGKDITYHNTNELINPSSKYYYPKAIGLKTGTSTKAGNCLVSAECMNKKLIICVVMNSSINGRWTDSLKLLTIDGKR